MKITCKLLVCGMFFYAIPFFAQKVAQEPLQDDSLRLYRASAEKENDVVHTKLELKPDFDQYYIYGKAWIEFHPHFYPTDHVDLDAKAMKIRSVALVEAGQHNILTYAYDKKILHIELPRTYRKEEHYTIYIEYIACPEERKQGGSSAISSDKGFFFINPTGKLPNKPRQFWTQGETESNSVWFPTIDKPNQKSTAEISITVPKSFVTLSNGLMEKQKEEGDWRTDYWVMKQPHAPYLFFVAGGEYAVVKDSSYKGKEVSYYVYKEYVPFAKRIFGETPAMMDFFSTLLKVDYPWDKYAQIIGADFVSGAMENTTATLHKESALQNARQLVDGNQWEYVIAHELFHHWFGDLVTAESWSNITLNESFADYGEYLWAEHRHGKEEAEWHRYKAIQQYMLESDNHQNPLVRYYYKDKEDVFDEVSYEKGGAILHMLRKDVGDDAFFASLNDYLQSYAYQATEVHQLKNSFEKITGKDLSWFFDQWYFSNGHPKVEINYAFLPNTKKVHIQIEQQGEKTFILPCTIDIHYSKDSVVRKQYLISRRSEDIVVDYSHNGIAPRWISVDADRLWVASRKDMQSTDAYIYQFQQGSVIAKIEALHYLQTGMKRSAKIKAAVFEGLLNATPHMQQAILQSIHDAGIMDELTKEQIKTIERIAVSRKNPLAQAEAIQCLGKMRKRSAYKKLFQTYVVDSSYTVAGSSLAALEAVDSIGVSAYFPTLQQDAKGRLRQELLRMYCERNIRQGIDYVIDAFDSSDFYTQSYYVICLMNILQQEQLEEKTAKKAIDALHSYYQHIPAKYSYLKVSFDGMKEANAMENKTPQLKGAVLEYFRHTFGLN